MPYRLQNDFAKKHGQIGFKEALVTDENDTLTSPPEKSDDLLVSKCKIFAVSNDFVDAIFKDNLALKSLKYDDEEQPYDKYFRSVFKWRFHTVYERLLQTETKTILTSYEQKRFNRQRQNMSKM